MQIFWDVGLKNLSYLIFNPNESTIVAWDVVDTGIRGKCGLTQIVKKMVDFFDSLSFLRTVSLCIIENQPRLNPTMRVISGILGTYMYTKYNQRVIYYNPSYKLMNVDLAQTFENAGNELPVQQTFQNKRRRRNPTERGNAYRMRKKASIYETRRILQEHTKYHTWLIFFENHRSKQDDLADTFLMALTYNKNPECELSESESESDSSSESEIIEENDSAFLQLLRTPCVQRVKTFEQSYGHYKFCLEDKLRKFYGKNESIVVCTKQILKASKCKGIVELKKALETLQILDDPASLSRFINWLLPEPHWKSLFNF